MPGTISPYPVAATQVQRPMNPTVKDEIRSQVVVLPALPGAPTPALDHASFSDAVRAANGAAVQSGAAWGVLELRNPANPAAPGALRIQPLGVARSDGYHPLSFDNHGPDQPIGGPYTDRFERTEHTATTGLLAIVGSNTFAGLTRGFSGEVASLEMLGLRAGIDRPIS